MWVWMLVSLFLLALGVIGLFLAQMRRRNVLRWLPTYLRQRHGPLPADRDIHVLLCFADHYEPKANKADLAAGQRRVDVWTEAFPRQFGRFRDSDGRCPRYTFFFPAEEYEKEYLDALAELCRAGYGEVELHLHHEKDTPEGLREKLESFRDLLVREHGLLSRDRHSGDVRFGFIHGNWALCNSRSDGLWCGVDNELAILKQAGCYADFTFPSAPDSSQPPIINSIYYACDIPGQKRSHDVGWPVGSITEPDDGLLLLQGPLLIDWQHRKWGVIPGVENGCVQGSQPPSVGRLVNWLRARVQVSRRPDWFFVKLHAHGAPEEAHEVLLGETMVRFHEDLARLARENPHFHYHYVTAREMVNLVKAAEAGYQGPVAGARDYQLISNLAAHSAYGFAAS